jgi:hypothetical protein
LRWRPWNFGEISRLQPGDLIAFADNGDIEVTLSANGKALYTCALGKSRGHTLHGQGRRRRRARRKLEIGLFMNLMKEAAWQAPGKLGTG